MKQKVQHQIREINHQWDDITQHSMKQNWNQLCNHKLRWESPENNRAVLHVICPLQCCTSCPEDCWNQGRKWPSLRCNSPNSHLPHPLEPRILDRTRKKFDPERYCPPSYSSLVERGSICIIFSLRFTLKRKQSGQLSTTMSCCLAGALTTALERGLPSWRLTWLSLRS